MATRASSRIKSKPKPNYAASLGLDQNENTPSEKKSTRRRNKKASASAVSDDSELNDTKKTFPKSTRRKRASDNDTDVKVKKVKSSAVDENDDCNAVTSKLGKRKAASKPEDKEMTDKKAKFEKKISVKDEITSNKCVVPVDPYCSSRVNDSAVACDANNLPYDAMLNQTNVGSNNNKYYLLQLLHDNSGRYWTWFRWGRIGYTTNSNTTLKSHATITAAISEFEKKFKDKTKNNWDERDDFVKYPGKYDLVILDYSAKKDEDETVETEEVKKEPVESKLDHRLLSLIELISNIKAMESAVVEMNYDVKKSPLGKLSKDQIKHGYEALRAIEECIKSSKTNSAQCRDACSDFYTRIPHNFGFKVPPLIKTLEEVKLKMDLLDALIDIEAAVKIIKSGNEDHVHKADNFYQNLKCDMKPLEKDSEMFQMLSEYLHNTHGHTHTDYKLKVEEIFQLKKEGEDERFIDHGNKQLLWHGSRLTNWGGIFSQGLRIAPPEAPVTGYMFGKGVYFADMVSKSANYCCASRQRPTAILLLAEVSLGSERELLESDYYANKLPSGRHSTKGLGRNAPDPKQTKFIGDVKVPSGKPVKTGVNNPRGYTLEYNEYIVYDVKQIKMKYAFKVNFDYRR